MKNHRAEGYCRTLECEGVEEDSGDRLNFNTATGLCLYSLRVSTYFKNKKTPKKNNTMTGNRFMLLGVCVFGGGGVCLTSFAKQYHTLSLSHG